MLYMFNNNAYTDFRNSRQTRLDSHLLYSSDLAGDFEGGGGLGCPLVGLGQSPGGDQAVKLPEAPGFSTLKSLTFD